MFCPPLWLDKVKLAFLRNPLILCQSEQLRFLYRRETSRAEVEENERRLEIFLPNSKKVKCHNVAFQKGQTPYAITSSESPFAGLTDEEFWSVYLMDE